MPVTSTSLVADIVRGTDGAVISSGYTMTTATDLTDAVGKYIRIEGAGPSSKSSSTSPITTVTLVSGHRYALCAKITAATRTGGTTTLTLNVAASATLSGLSWTCGTDNGPAINTALSAATVPLVVLPAGEFGIWTPILLPLGAHVEGKGYHATKLVGLSDSAWVLDAAIDALLPGNTGYTGDGHGPKLYGIRVDAQYGARLGWLDTDTVVNPSSPLSTVAVSTLSPSYLSRSIIEDCFFAGHYDPSADPSARLYPYLPTENELRLLGGVGLQLGARVINAVARNCWFQGSGIGVRMSAASHATIKDSRFHVNARHLHFNSATIGGFPEGDTCALDGCKATSHYRTGAFFLSIPNKFQFRNGNNFECADRAGLTGTGLNQHIRVEGGGTELEIFGNHFSAVAGDSSACPMLSLDLDDRVNLNRVENNFFGGATSATFEFKTNYTVGLKPRIRWVGNYGNHVAPTAPTVQLTKTTDPLLFNRSNIPGSFNGPYNTSVAGGTNTYNPSSAWPWAYDSTYGVWAVTSGGTDNIGTLTFPIPNPGMRIFTVQVTGLARGTVAGGGNGSIHINHVDPKTGTTTILNTSLGFGAVPAATSPSAIGFLETLSFDIEIPAAAPNANAYFDVAATIKTPNGVDIVEIRFVPAALQLVTTDGISPQIPASVQVVENGSNEIIPDLSLGTQFYWANGGSTGAFTIKKAINGVPGQLYVLEIIVAHSGQTFSFGTGVTAPSSLTFANGTRTRLVYSLISTGGGTYNCELAATYPADVPGPWVLTAAANISTGSPWLTAAGAYDPAQLQAVIDWIALVTAKAL